MTMKLDTRQIRDGLSHVIPWSLVLATLGFAGVASIEHREAGQQAMRADSHLATAHRIEGATVMVSGSGRIVDWSPGMVDMLGWSRDQMIGRPLTKVIPRSYHVDHIDGFSRAMATAKDGSVTYTSCEAISKNGNRVNIVLRIRVTTVNGHRLAVAQVDRDPKMLLKVSP